MNMPPRPRTWSCPHCHQRPPRLDVHLKFECVVLSDKRAGR